MVAVGRLYATANRGSGGPRQVLLPQLSQETGAALILDIPASTQDMFSLWGYCKFVRIRSERERGPLLRAVSACPFASNHIGKVRMQVRFKNSSRSISPDGRLVTFETVESLIRRTYSRSALGCTLLQNVDGTAMRLRATPRVSLPLPILRIIRCEEKIPFIWSLTIGCALKWGIKFLIAAVTAVFDREFSRISGIGNYSLEFRLFWTTLLSRNKISGDIVSR